MVKKKVDPSVNQSKSVSTRGVKRSAKDEAKEKTEETNTEKRVKLDEKDTDDECHERKEGDEELNEMQLETGDMSDSETSFMDLPDDIHLKIFALLDLPSRLKLRLNKRLDRLHFSVKTHRSFINLEIGKLQTRLTFNLARIRSDNFTKLEKLLRRFSVNTFVDIISITIAATPHEEHCSLIDALFQFKADSLHISAKNNRKNFAHPTLPSFLTLAQNVRMVFLDVCCTSLTAQDLCSIRKTIIEGSCMKSFCMPIGNATMKSFVKDCFAVYIEEATVPVPGKIYFSLDDSIEIYSKHPNFGGMDMQHFDRDLKTSILCGCIRFQKLDVVKKPHDKYKLRLNHMYHRSSSPGDSDSFSDSESSSDSD